MINFSIMIIGLGAFSVANEAFFLSGHDLKKIFNSSPVDAHHQNDYARNYDDEDEANLYQRNNDEQLTTNNGYGSSNGNGNYNEQPENEKFTKNKFVKKKAVQYYIIDDDEECRRHSYDQNKRNFNQHSGKQYRKYIIIKPVSRRYDPRLASAGSATYRNYDQSNNNHQRGGSEQITSLSEHYASPNSGPEPSVDYKKDFVSGVLIAVPKNNERSYSNEEIQEEQKDLPYPIDDGTQNTEYLKPNNIGYAILQYKQ